MLTAIPRAILEQHTAVLGKTGAGKTSTAKLMAEQVAAAGERVCILDPVKSDWWGLTSSADGQRPGLPFHILGGPRGHVPLHSSAGAAIGELVATGALPLSIIDMADFEPGGLQRFFVDFAPALLRKMRGVVHLVIEEAHEFAPKERAGIGQENLAIHWAKKLATAGRSKGIRLILATQRTQALHNAMLGSCETIIAHRLTAPADQAPVLDWLKANASKEKREAVAASLSSLKTGCGWICSGEAGIFEQVQFPRIKTYDNTATPTSGSGEHRVATAPVDQERLRAIIGTAVKEAEENDPKRLKAEIARLTRELAAGAAPADDLHEIEKARARDYERGHQEGYAAGRVDGSRDTMKFALATLGPAAAAIESAASAMTTAEKTLDAWHTTEAQPYAAPAPHPAPRPIIPPRGITRSATNGSGKVHGDLTPALQRVVNAIAWWRKIGREPVEKDRACVVAGYSPRASTFGVYLADLAKRGLIESLPGMVRLTPAGLAVAEAPDADDRQGLHDVARGLLGPQEARVFDVVYAAYPKEIRRDDVARKVGLSPDASTVGVYISGVAAYGIIEASSRGHVRAADWLFP